MMINGFVGMYRAFRRRCEPLENDVNIGGIGGIGGTRGGGITRWYREIYM